MYFSYKITSDIVIQKIIHSLIQVRQLTIYFCACIGIGFAPIKQEVNVEDGPVSNINFQPIKAELKGKVECIEKQKCSPVQVMLTSTQVSSRKEIEVKGDGKFQFSSVIPSTYKIEVSKDNRCWEKQSQQLDVSSNIDNIMFRQLGYYLTVNSGHSTTLVLSGPNGKTIQEEFVRKGENVICVKTNNIVSLSTKGCEEFEITPSKVNLQDESLPTVNLKPIRYRVSGSVKTKKPISDIGLVAKVSVDSRLGHPPIRECSYIFHSFFWILIHLFVFHSLTTGRRNLP
jgi:hypothetical protein